MRVLQAPRQRAGAHRAVVAAAAVVSVAAIASASGARATEPIAWSTYGAGPTRSGYVDEDFPPRTVLRRVWSTRLQGNLTSQLLVTDTAAGTTLYVGTNAGAVYAIGAGGRPRWRARFGSLRHSCAQLGQWGIVGTGAIDNATHAAYFTDIFGRLHALDLVTQTELPGWPVELYESYLKEVVWGAIAIVDGAAYIGTASYCDRPMEGKLIRVDLKTRAVSRWIAVPAELGGGGGIWGWGGVAYSPLRDSLLVVTGNAFRGGKNVGRNFREDAGYGEKLVELSPRLDVRAASHPANIRPTGDYDFVGSPVPFMRQGCGELVAALNKNGWLYVWPADKIAAGPTSSVRVSKATLRQPLLSQAAHSPRLNALFMVSFHRIFRVDINTSCRARVAWSRRLGAGLLNSSPTVSGDTVWFVRNADRSTLLGIDARTGAIRFRGSLRSPVFAAPTVFRGRIYVPTWDGDVTAFRFASVTPRWVSVS
ncbi:MAG: PQQ-binding-like beta-propeller repeat protein [Actinomycetota bacterium]|nr:PQQ-binding-like beta-propeller repeat protein [Actinomycetota bacterium]